MHFMLYILAFFSSFFCCDDQACANKAKSSSQSVEVASLWEDPTVDEDKEVIPDPNDAGDIDIIGPNK